MSDPEETGLVPAQWIVRVVGAAAFAVFAAAVLGSLDDIKRYLEIKDM